MTPMRGALRRMRSRSQVTGQALRASRKNLQLKPIESGLPSIAAGTSSCTDPPEETEDTETRLPLNSNFT